MLKGRNIGNMDVLLTIEQPGLSRNSINEDEVSWMLYTQVYAERIWNSAGDRFEGKQETGIDNVQFNARYYPLVNATMRLKQGIETSYFYITNVRSSPREGLMIINAESRNNMDESNSLVDLNGLIRLQGYWDASGGTLPPSALKGYQWIIGDGINEDTGGGNISYNGGTVYLAPRSVITANIDNPGQNWFNWSNT